MGEAYEIGREERCEREGGRWREYVVQLVAYGGESRGCGSRSAVE